MEKAPKFRHGICYSHHVETSDAKTWNAHIKELEVHQVLIQYKDGGWIRGELALYIGERKEVD